MRLKPASRTHAAGRLSHSRNDTCIWEEIFRRQVKEEHLRSIQHRVGWLRLLIRWPLCVCISCLSLQRRVGFLPHSGDTNEHHNWPLWTVCAVGDVVTINLFYSQTAGTGYGSEQLNLRHLIEVNPDRSTDHCVWSL